MNDKQSCVYNQVTSKMSCFNWIPAFAGMTASKRGLMQKLLSGEWHIKTVISGKPWTTEKNCHPCESRDPQSTRHSCESRDPQKRCHSCKSRNLQKTCHSYESTDPQKTRHPCESRAPPEKVEDFRSRGLDYIDRSKHQWIASLFMNKRQGFKRA